MRHAQQPALTGLSHLLKDDTQAYGKGKSPVYRKVGEPQPWRTTYRP